MIESVSDLDQVFLVFATTPDEQKDVGERNDDLHDVQCEVGVAEDVRKVDLVRLNEEAAAVC